MFVPSSNTPILPPQNTSTIAYEFLDSTNYTVAPNHRFYPATNNIWNQIDLVISGMNDTEDPILYRGDNYVFNRFFQLNLSGDDLAETTTEMTNPHILAISKALNAPKYSVNELDPTIPRVDDLGWRIQRANEVLGIRVKSDGTIDEALEKTTNRRTHASGSDSNNVQDYNPNCFGKKGMLLRIMPNKFSADGTVPGGYSKVRDLPQMLAELHEQANAAMGYQEGTAIEIKLDGKTYRYPNQLALLTELFVTAKQTAIYSKGTFFSSIVAEQSIKEVMAGLGLRTVDKFLEFKVAGKVAKLYYKGVSASQSLSRLLSAISTNIGMIIGNII